MTITQKLAQFTEWALTEGPWAGYDLDGGTIQDKAIELGLLTETTYDPAVHGEQDADPGDPWFMLSDELKAALKEE